ncbi:MAG: pseudouridine synthase [Firmicutes bacterium]|nr:pseudouridine synthase [Bacillota bacterium]
MEASQKEPVRLQKVLSQAGVASRRHAEELIAAGRVMVNGVMVTQMGTKVTALDEVTLDGKRIGGQANLVYVLLYKPAATVTTTRDPEGRKTVMACLRGVTERVFPVGRLDYETDGALILTNDGDLANRLMHPRFGIEKTYRAIVSGKVTSQEVEALSSGVLLDDGPTAPASVRLLGTDGLTSTVELRVHEGRNRQVRRMMEAVSHPVLSLTRTAYGPLDLRGLRPGTWRYLSPEEVAQLRVGKGPGPGRAEHRSRPQEEHRKLTKGGVHRGSRQRTNSRSR